MGKKHARNFHTVTLAAYASRMKGSPLETQEDSCLALPLHAAASYTDPSPVPALPPHTDADADVVMDAASLSHQEQNIDASATDETGLTALCVVQNAKILHSAPPPAVPLLILVCVYEHGAHVRSIPAKVAQSIGEINYCDATAGTGRTHVELHGVMYTELAVCDKYPIGGWVSVTKHDGQPVMRELEVDLQTHYAYLRYRCVFVHGAHVRDTPAQSAHLIGEIDYGDVVTMSGRVDTDEGSGITYLELVYCGKYPIGGWIPLLSQGGHLVMQAVECSAAAEPQAEIKHSSSVDIDTSRTDLGWDNIAAACASTPPAGARGPASASASASATEDWTVDECGLYVPALLSRRSPQSRVDAVVRGLAVAGNH